MGSFLKGLFSDNGEVSMMRVMSLIALLIGGALALIGLYLNKDLNQLSMLAGTFVGFAFGGKVGQKFAEIKTPKPGEVKDVPIDDPGKT